ncbi:conserved exported protein of unknown function [Hyphomicrobium sp. MC1]|nr:conserved exported protein of unknown function [Hyphomicrobium sp. MC1]
MGGYLKRTASRAGVSLLAIACAGSAACAVEATTGCSKEDFEAVVEEAAGSLRDLNLKNRPPFQEKLRALKDKRHWSHDEFMEKAKPFVRDDKTVIYDQTTNELLSEIAMMGQQGAEADTPDCARMQDLREHMKKLIDTLSAKWAYMFQKLDAELAN